MITAYEVGSQNLIFASKGIKGICPDCSQPLITKCGSFIQPHFAHWPAADCESTHYYDGISSWHINWQYLINNPKAGINIEVPIKCGNYRKRADLITPAGLIIEFQKSPMPLSERLLREKQYENLIWVIHETLKTSKTWKDLHSEINIFVDYGNKGLLNRRYGWVLPKSRFIRSIINSPIYNEAIPQKISERAFRSIWHQGLDYDQLKILSNEFLEWKYSIRPQYYRQFDHIPVDDCWSDALSQDKKPIRKPFKPYPELHDEQGNTVEFLDICKNLKDRQLRKKFGLEVGACF